MGSVKLLQNNFISGEVSPLIEGRIDSPRYLTGLRTCQNALPHRYGGWSKRPGTKYVGTTQGNKKARLIEFVDADGRCFIIELTDLQLRIWSQEYLALVGAPVVLASPWGEAILKELKYTVIGGKLYVVHRSLAPRVVTNINGLWTIDTLTFTGDRTFSTVGNYPGVAFTLAGRLGLASTNNEPTAIFLSMAPNASTGAMRYTEFAFTNSSGYLTADSAIYLLESDLTPILWAAGGRKLFTGTHTQIWMDVGAGVTPVDFDMSILSNNGANTVQAVVSEAVVVYAGRGGRSLHALLHDTARDSYQEVTLSIGAEHFLASPVVDIAFQNFPSPVLWLVREDGLLVSCSLDLASGMIAWAKHPMAGKVESIAVGHSKTEDILWLSELRGSTRTVEYLRFQDVVATPDAAFYHVDCGIAQAYGTPTATITGLAHLEGQTVAAWGDGKILPDRVVTSGQVQYPEAISSISIGLPIATIVETLRPEIPLNGTGQGNFKQIEEAAVRVYRSAGGKIGITGGEKVPFASWRTPVWEAVSSPYTGDLEAQLAAPVEKNATLVIEHASAAPFNLLAVMYRIGIKEA